MADLKYTPDDRSLLASEFRDLASRAWPGEYSLEGIKLALSRTINSTAREQDGTLVGTVRVLSDGYFFGTIPELMVDPAYRGGGVGRKLMELAWETSPSSLYFGAQPGKEGFYGELGYEKGLQSFFRRKRRE